MSETIKLSEFKYSSSMVLEHEKVQVSTPPDGAFSMLKETVAIALAMAVSHRILSQGFYLSNILKSHILKILVITKFYIGKATNKDNLYV